MDEDDSPDELINRSMSHNKGKRPALWAISDDSEDNEAESEEGASDSDEEEEEEHQDGEDDEEEDEEEDREGNEEDDEEEDDDEEDEDAKAEGGAVGGTSADLTGLSSDEDSDKCPICLNSFSSQPVATPENCEHYFCLDCILEWAKNANSCPVDRIAFNSIYLRKCFGGKVKKIITVQKPVKEAQEETVDVDLEQTNCEVCGGSDREDRLLLCDGCDAGYHMECLTPPLDSVPVEEWFCPECESNNRNPRGSAEELSDAESLPSSSGPTTSRPQTRTAGPTRAIARTQQSERVRANVNRNRITQARTSQLAPTYLMQSTWLDETINAVVAGLNTSVYIRNFTPRAPTRRRRKTGKRRKVKKTSSAKGKKGKAATTGVKRRKRKVRRTKSRKKFVRPTTPRSRIASSLGIAKDKKSSSLPTMYRPSEHTLSNMRADIGAASLSIYGDPFDLDPFVDREEDEQQAHVASLLAAKRRGISRSALRSHQPVARPFTAGFSRRAVDVPQPGGVVEASPVPDLLGSILSGQSMLLMDSSDVVINRDGSLKVSKPIMPSVSKPGCSKSSSSGDANTRIDPVMSPNQGDTPLLHHNGDLPGSSHSSTSRPLPQSSSRLPPYMSPSASRVPPFPSPDLPHRGHPSSQPYQPIRSNYPPNQRGTDGVIDSAHLSSTHPRSDSNHKSNQPAKASVKPMWVDVSVLPRIPKIRRESSDSTNTSSQGAGSSNIRSSNGSREHSGKSTPVSNVYGMPDTGMTSLAGEKGRQQSVDQQKGRAEGPPQRQRPDGASSSSAFSNSFSSSSSSAGYSSSQSRYSSSSVASSSVSFRINSSGNSWHSRRMSTSSSPAGGGSMQDQWSKQEEEVKKRQMHRDKQMLLASHNQVKKEQDINNIYDPFNPTMSDSSSDDEAGSSQNITHEVKASSLGNKNSSVQNKQDLVQVKSETQETEVSPDKPRRASAQGNTSAELRSAEVSIKTEKESRLVNTKPVKQTASLDGKLKEESRSHVEKDGERVGHGIKSLHSDKADNILPVRHSPVQVKTEREMEEMTEEREGTSHCAPQISKNNSTASSSASTKRKEKIDIKMEVESSSKSPSRDLGHKKKSSHVSKEPHSSSSETEKSRREGHHGSRRKENETNQERSSRRSRSRERKEEHTTSESSHSASPDRTRRRRSRSRSKDRRRSRSGSSSSGSREHSRRKRSKRSSKERTDSRKRDYEKRRQSKDKRRGRSRSTSLSRSRSRSRSRDRRRGRSRSRSRSKSRSRSRSKERRKHTTQPQSSALTNKDKGESRSKDKRRPRSRSSSRERRKDRGSSYKSSQKTSGASVSSSKDTKPTQEKKKERDLNGSSVKEEKTASLKKEETPVCTATPKVKNEVKELKLDDQAAASDTTKELKMKKEIKKEKQPMIDMFEDSPVIKPIKEEVFDTDVLEIKDKEENKNEPVKTEKCEIQIIQFESSPPESQPLPPVTSFPSLTTPVGADDLQDSGPQSQPEASEEPPNTAGSTVSVKQEAQQPSDLDEDFNVDVMLDNLDYVKSEPTEGGGESVKQEKDTEEGKNEGEQASTAVGTKSKTQVKRVTWNIQEPEGPQPEKSASKLALYKLRLKQEGVRRPSSASHLTSQENRGAASDPSKKSVSSSSKSDVAQSEPSAGKGELEEGDTLHKDKQYLKKLHMQERAIEEVKLAIKPFYQRRDINKDEYKEILRKAVQKVCHSKSGEINPVKVGNLVKAYVDKYKHARKHKKAEDSGTAQEAQTEATKTNSP